MFSMDSASSSSSSSLWRPACKTCIGAYCTPVGCPRYDGRYRMPQALVLFDIDGTLLRRAGVDHRQALEEAVRKVTGFETTTEGVPVSGMLDRDILAAMLVNVGA